MFIMAIGGYYYNSTSDMKKFPTIKAYDKIKRHLQTAKALDSLTYE